MLQAMIALPRAAGDADRRLLRGVKFFERDGSFGPACWRA